MFAGGSTCTPHRRNPPREGIVVPSRSTGLLKESGCEEMNTWWKKRMSDVNIGVSVGIAGDDAMAAGRVLQ